MKKYLVIGNPIEHSLSPKIHNWWLKEYNIDAVYDKVKLEKHEIKNFIQDIKQQKIIGCNVTVPFKNSVIPFIDKLSLAAEQTQSVNTIVFDDGDLVGHNTDITGFGTAIKKLNFNMKGKKILILGAGGVVPSIIFALYKMKVLSVTLSNRTKSKAEYLKNYYDAITVEENGLNKIMVVDWGEIPEFDMVINATSVGLKNDEKLGLDFSKIGKGKFFYDVIYNPKETNFLKIGKDLGNKTENGKKMFIYQAAEAFKIWHNIQPQIDDEVSKILD